MEKRLKRFLNKIVIKGQTKKTFFRPAADFELQIYYSIKNKIIIINISGIRLDHPQLGIKLRADDFIEPVLAWVEKNGHQIIYQRNRSEK